MLNDPVVRKTFLQEMERVGEIAKKIISARRAAGVPGNGWPESGPAFTDAGVEFYGTEPRQYDDGDEMVTMLVPWEEIEDADNVLRDLTIKAANAAMERKKAQEEWDRKKLAELKAKLGEK